MDARVELRRGGLEAVAVLGQGPGDREALARFVREELARLGVEAPPPEATIRQSIEAAGPAAQEVLVAEGLAPQPGINAQLIAFFPIRDTPGEEGTDPLVAYGRNVVYPGDDILRKTPASEGIAGRNLLGASLPASHGKDAPVIPGEGVRSEEGGLLFRSATYGVVLFYLGRLRVANAVRVADDRMQAWVAVLPDSKNDETGQLDAVLKALASLGVTHGIDRDAVAEGVRRARESGQSTPWLVAARGQPPVDGREADYRLLIDLDKKTGTMVEGDRIDFKELATVKNVAKGQALAEIVPGQPPIPGFRIDGTTLVPRVQGAQGLKPGDHTMLSADGTQVVSDADGMIALRGGKFHVDDEYVVPADVDFTTGNIHASGSVRVRGQVTSGFVVQAGKDAEIFGDVWEGVVEAQGEVKVRGAITAGSRVKSGSHVSARFILNSTVESEGDLDVALSITGSEIYVKGHLRVVGAQGVILGGEVNAALGIEARTIGSSGSRTRVVVGMDVRVARELEEIGKARPAIQEELQILQRALGKEFLRDPKAALLALPPALRKPKIDVLQRMKTLQQKGIELAARHDELSQVMSGALDARVAVIGEIHAGTAVTIGRAKIVLPEALKHVILHYDPAHNGVVWRRM